MRGKFTGNAVAFPVSRFNSRWVVRRFQFEKYSIIYMGYFATAFFYPGQGLGCCCNQKPKQKNPVPENGNGKRERAYGKKDLILSS